MVGRLHGLEAIRGVAAILVVYHHAGLLADYPDAPSRLFDQAYLGVDLFFLLSGFVLTRTYEARMPDPARFLARRFVRLWPPIACGVVISACYFAARGMAPEALVLNLATGLLILPLYGYINFNPPAWSIFFELIANFLHALALRRISTRGLFLIAGTCAVWLAGQLGNDGLDVGWGTLLALGLPRVLMSYALGVAMWRVLGDCPRLPAALAWPAVLGFALAIAAYPDALRGPAEIVFVLLVNPLVLLAALSMNESRLAAILGALSFPLYALHFPLQTMTTEAGAAWQTSLVVSLVGALSIGVLVDPRWRAVLLGFVGPKRQYLPAT